MGLEWRGPHVTIPVCLLHYVWIPKLNVYRDGSYQAPQVPQYHGTPQTKPGVTNILNVKQYKELDNIFGRI